MAPLLLRLRLRWELRVRRLRGRSRGSLSEPFEFLVLLRLLAAEGLAPALLPVPCFGDLYGPGGDEALVPMGDVHEDRVSIIMHSSGGSGLRANALVPGSRPANV